MQLAIGSVCALPKQERRARGIPDPPRPPGHEVGTRIGPLDLSFHHEHQTSGPGGPLGLEDVGPHDHVHQPPLFPWFEDPLLSFAKAPGVVGPVNSLGSGVPQEPPRNLQSASQRAVFGGHHQLAQEGWRMSEEHPLPGGAGFEGQGHGQGE